MSEIAIPKESLVTFPHRLILFIARHWLFLINTAVGLFVGLPFLAPLLMAAGYTTPAAFIYFLYRLTCHQLPQRSFFLGGPRATYSFDQISAFTGETSFLDLTHRPITHPALGYQVAFCQRDVAIYGTIFLAGVIFALLRHRLKPLSLKLYLLLIAPMAVDGLTQLLGWRESTWELRTITGALFGLASVWLVYPYLEMGMGEIRADLEKGGGVEDFNVRSR
ncbi:MAG: DUF2085 domain-containing protein [Anaerolineae bacterium]